MHEISDNNVIEDILNGDREQYRLLVEKYQQTIFRICVGYAHDEDDANDLTQEVFIKAYQGLSTFGFKSAFKTWLYRIAINVSLNAVRSKRVSIFGRIDDFFSKSSDTVPLPNTDLQNPEEIMISEEHTSLVKNEIDKLPEKQRTAFILSKYDDLAQKEVAAIMNITEGAVESLLQRAKMNLHKRLSTYFKKNI